MKTVIASYLSTYRYQRIIPALGFMLFIGNTYFSWMATRMATQYGRDFVAQPYGVNTVRTPHQTPTRSISSAASPPLPFVTDPVAILLTAHIVQVGAFPFIFGIMGPIITHGYSDVGHGGDYVITGDDIIKGWKAGCAGNFIVGLVGIVLGILMGIPLTANMILKVGTCREAPNQASRPTTRISPALGFCAQFRSLAS